jgi:hypothetical protein
MPRTYTRRYLPGTIFPRKGITSIEDSTRHFFKLGTSKIRGAGIGLFARTFIPIGTLIGIYRGIVMSKEDLDAKYGAGNDTIAPYAVEMQRDDGSTFFVDAQDPNWPNSNWTRYMNSPWGTNAHSNVEMNGNGEFRATKDITVDCELLWNYGSTYFIDPDVHIIESITNC